MIEAKIIKDSLAPSGVRLTTFVLKYPRFIHSEFLTHRMFSRNASSSRAIPVKKQIRSIITEMAAPIHWGANQKGMQARSEVIGWKLKLGQYIWRLSGYTACGYTYMLSRLGLHKQIANRLTEPFSHINVICTSVTYENFFNLRCHKDAQPEICDLATKMEKRYKIHVPNILKAGEWHLPFVDEYPKNEIELKRAIRDSVACCARVSYKLHDSTKPTHDDNVKLHDMLLNSNPQHASPAEHQAKARDFKWPKSGNFYGWRQYRKIVERWRKL